MTTQSKTIKFISILLIISILLPSVLLSKPKKASAQYTDVIHSAISTVNGVFQSVGSASTVTNTGISIKNVAIEIGKQLLKVAAKRILAKMTQATINWINSGFHGAPLFLENPGSFFKDIAKTEVRSLVDLIGYDTFRFPFGKQTALNIIDSYKSQLEINAQYSLSRVINDPDLLVRYRNDFNVGGWNGFLINTQYPQNNYLGFNMIIQQNLASRLQGTLQAPAERVQSLLQQGMGFLSPQTCPSNPKYNNGTNEFLRPSFKSTVVYIPPASEPANTYLERDREARATYQNAKDAEKAKYTEENTCPGGLVSTTPGSVAANQVFSALNAPFLTTALDGALGNSLAAIFDALINKLVDTGLNSLSSTVNPGPRNDNWSYNGQTLGGSTTTIISGTGPLNIPQNVSVLVGQTTSTNVSGGAGPYSIETSPNATVASARISLASSSGPTLTITGIAPGSTIVRVKDSSVPFKTVDITITVSALGDLVISPANISAEINIPFVATISGGQEPYFMRILPNEAIAIVAPLIHSGTNLIVTGVAKGTTFVEIEDSSIPKNIVRVPIIISGPDDLVIQQNVAVNINQQISVPISSGAGPFIITNQSNTAAATAEILPARPNFLSVTGRAPGTNTITVNDSLNKSTFVVIITSAPLGNCRITTQGRFDGDSGTFETTQPNMTEAQCGILNGQWSQNSTP